MNAGASTNAEDSNVGRSSKVQDKATNQSTQNSNLQPREEFKARLWKESSHDVTPILLWSSGQHAEYQASFTPHRPEQETGREWSFCSLRAGEQTGTSRRATKGYGSHASPNANQMVMQAILTDSHDSLINSETYEHCLYKSTPEKNQQFVDDTLDFLTKKILMKEDGTLSANNVSENQRRLIRQLIGLYTIASKLIGAFVPEKTSSTVLEKFWGSMYTIVMTTVGSRPLT